MEFREDKVFYEGVEQQLLKMENFDFKWEISLIV